jgi:hypothetical protein
MPESCASIRRRRRSLVKAASVLKERVASLRDAGYTQLAFDNGVLALVRELGPTR